MTNSNTQGLRTMTKAQRGKNFNPLGGTDGLQEAIRLELVITSSLLSIVRKLGHFPVDSIKNPNETGRHDH